MDLIVSASSSGLPFFILTVTIYRQEMIVECVPNEKLLIYVCLVVSLIKYIRVT